MQYPVDAFHFSQRSLADFLICRRRFQLRYLEQVPWPAPFSQADPELEALMELGQTFHQAAHQYFVGVDPSELIAGHADPRLKAWWRAFESQVLPRMPQGERWPEAALSIPVDGSWLSARFDLLVVAPSGEATIFDWKTGHMPEREILARDMQTRVYPLVLAESGHLEEIGREIRPDDITMIYWYAQAPTEWVAFPYSAADHAQNRQELRALVGEIIQLGADQFPKVDDLAPCRRCNYRAYCQRDVVPAPAAEFVDEEVDFIRESAAPYELEPDL
jgi:hypothetical protein